MHRMMKALIRRRGMGNGNGNGNGNGRNSSGFIQLAQLASTGVLILGMFGLWWGSANPSARLDKIETNQLDNRKELNDIISGLRKEISSSYTSLREHNEFQNRLKDNIDELHKADDNFVTKVQFEAWKAEREILVQTELKRLDTLEADLKNVYSKVMTKDEADHRWATEYKVDESVDHRIDLLTADIQKLRETITVNPTEIMSRRIDQLYEGMRLLQTQVFDAAHNKGNGK